MPCSKCSEYADDCLCAEKERDAWKARAERAEAAETALGGALDRLALLEKVAEAARTNGAIAISWEGQDLHKAIAALDAPPTKETP